MIGIFYNLKCYSQSNKLISSKKTDWVTIFSEHFDNNQHNWDLLNKENQSRVISSGKLIITNNLAGNLILATNTIPFDFNNRDFEITFSISNLNAYGSYVYNNNGRKEYIDMPNWGFFWGADINTSNLNSISFWGYKDHGKKCTTFKIVSMVNGNGIEYETFASSYLFGLEAGDNFKVIQISKKGDKTYFFDKMILVNEGVLAGIPSPECLGNEFGIIVGSGSKVLVDYIEIKGESDYSYTRKFYDKGWSSIDNNNYDDAIYYFNKVINSGFKHPDSYIDRAFANYLKENYSEGLKDCDTALLYDNTFEDAYYVSGLIKYQLGYEDEVVINELMKAGEKGKKVLEKYFPTYDVKKATGSGIILSKNGYIATNYHVINNAKKITIYRSINGITKSYKGNVVLVDNINDLAILKIDTTDFSEFKEIPFNLRSSGVLVGENVFALGYPMIELQGIELKVTDGIISSKTGFQNDLSTYQISVPIQPGNSGGPLFDYNGNLIGITSSKLTVGENVGYAIKGIFLKNLIDNIADLELPESKTDSFLNGKPLPKQIDILRDFVVIISVVF